MRMRTLPSLPGIESAAGWSHPYPAGPFSPFWYADGDQGDGDGDGTGDGDQGDGDGSDTGDADDAGDDGKGDDGTVDHKAEAEKWRALAKKHEQRAKSNAGAAKELADLKRKGMSDTEKAVDEAVAAAVAQERVKAGEKVARSAFLAAAKGRIDNAKDVADEVNLRKYVDDEGEVDEDAISGLVDKLAPKQSGTDQQDGNDDREGGSDTRRRRGGGFDQGARRKGGGKDGKSIDAGRELYRKYMGAGTGSN